MAMEVEEGPQRPSVSDTKEDNTPAMPRDITTQTKRIEYKRERACEHGIDMGEWGVGSGWCNSRLDDIEP